MMTTIHNVLDTIVSTQNIFYIRLHQFHWYVKGPDFFDLHSQFEQLYTTVTSDMDEVAERLLTIGGEPSATSEELAKLSVISESVDDKSLSAHKMVEAVVEDLKAYTAVLKKGIDLSDEIGDDVTNDLLISIRATMDKQIWIFQAFLNKQSNV